MTCGKFEIQLESQEDMFDHVTVRKLRLLSTTVSADWLFLTFQFFVYIWSEIFRSPTWQKVKPNMAAMEALSYVGFSPPARFLRNT